MKKLKGIIFCVFLAIVFTACCYPESAIFAKPIADDFTNKTGQEFYHYSRNSVYRNAIPNYGANTNSADFEVYVRYYFNGDAITDGDCLTIIGDYDDFAAWDNGVDENPVVCVEIPVVLAIAQYDMTGPTVYFDSSTNEPSFSLKANGTVVNITPSDIVTINSSGVLGDLLFTKVLFYPQDGGNTSEYNFKLTNLSSP